MTAKTTETKKTNPFETFVKGYQKAMLTGDRIVAVPLFRDADDMAKKTAHAVADAKCRDVATVLATTFASNLDDYRMQVDRRSFGDLVTMFAFLAYRNGVRSTDARTAESIATSMKINLAVRDTGLNDLLARAYPEMDAEPMFPDFPTQVIGMSEIEYRIHQLLHYASTYGVEQIIADVTGVDRRDVQSDEFLHVRDGYRPAVESTEKVKSDTAAHGALDKQSVRFVVTWQDIVDVVSKQLGRPTRMSDEQVNLATFIYTVDDEHVPTIDFKGGAAFKENGERIVAAVAQSAGADAASVVLACGQLLSNPMDVLKTVRRIVDGKNVSVESSWYLTRDKHADYKRNRIRTTVKRGLTEALLAYPVGSIVSNLADAKPKVRNAVKYLSLKRFIIDGRGHGILTADEYDSIMGAANGKVRSWNSKTEAAFASLKEIEGCAGGKGDAAFDKAKGIALGIAKRDLLEHMTERPGVLLRTLTRLVRCGLTADDFDAAGIPGILAERCSLATLLKMMTQMSVDSVATASVDEYGRLTVDRGKHGQAVSDKQRLAEYATVYESVLVPTVKKALAIVAARDERLAALSGKKVYVDGDGFSIDGSLVIPNDDGLRSAYPPVGMAFDFSGARTTTERPYIRFFTFWNDDCKRVDVDMHAQMLDANGLIAGHVGWNSSFRNSGVVTSGDDTVGKNAVEYIDVDVETALAHGVHRINVTNAIYSGASSWDDIQTVYCGASVVGSTDTDVKLYDAENVIYRYDLTGDGSRELTCVIDLDRLFARVHRGQATQLASAKFTLRDYVGMLLDACGVSEVVDSADDADEVVHVGQNADGAWSIVGERFFVDVDRKPVEGVKADEKSGE